MEKQKGGLDEQSLTSTDCLIRVFYCSFIYMNKILCNVIRSRGEVSDFIMLFCCIYHMIIYLLLVHFVLSKRAKKILWGELKHKKLCLERSQTII